MIFGFIHAALMGDWEQTLSEQIGLIRSSGLYDLCDALEVCESAPDTYEFPTLDRLYDNALKFDGVCFYTHLKGVSKTRSHWDQHAAFYDDFAGLKTLDHLRRNERLWRKYMEYFVIEQHVICLKTLIDRDTCGVEWREAPFPHYSGNFWWARHDYIRKLERPSTYKDLQDYRDVMGSNRATAEFWVGSGNPRPGVLWNTAQNLYHKGLSPHQYGKGKLF